MFRNIISVVLTLFLLFGIISSADYFFDKKITKQLNIKANVSEKKDNSLTIKEIEMITANENYSFTKENVLR